MTEQQLVTLAFAIIFPLSMLLYSNSRITEAKETLRAETQTLRVEMEKGHAQILTAIERAVAEVKGLESLIETRFRIHEFEHHR